MAGRATQAHLTPISVRPHRNSLPSPPCRRPPKLPSHRRASGRPFFTIRPSADHRITSFRPPSSPTATSSSWSRIPVMPEGGILRAERHAPLTAVVGAPLRSTSQAPSRMSSNARAPSTPTSPSPPVFRHHHNSSTPTVILRPVRSTMTLRRPSSVEPELPSDHARPAGPHHRRSSWPSSPITPFPATTDGHHSPYFHSIPTQLVAPRDRPTPRHSPCMRLPMPPPHRIAAQLGAALGRDHPHLGGRDPPDAKVFPPPLRCIPPAIKSPPTNPLIANVEPPPHGRPQMLHRSPHLHRRRSTSPPRSPDITTPPSHSSRRTPPTSGTAAFQPPPLATVVIKPRTPLPSRSPPRRPPAGEIPISHHPPPPSRRQYSTSVYHLQPPPLRSSPLRPPESTPSPSFVGNRRIHSAPLYLDIVMMWE